MAQYICTYCGKKTTSPSGGSCSIVESINETKEQKNQALRE